MKKSTEMDGLGASNGSINGNQENVLHPYPVSAYDSGEGLPYAPIDWPNAGDKWAWKVGGRIAASGQFSDRYLYPPKRLQDGSVRKCLASKKSVEQYIRTTFPDADVDAFFASFNWKIPSDMPSAVKDSKEDVVPLEELAEPSVSNSQIGVLACKAGNRTCCSSEVGNSPSRFMPCDICCNDAGFCRDCCCLICRKTIIPAYGVYSYIRCEAIVEGYICGHIAHINCGLRAYLAGTVGSMGLDAEYYCRRCDSRSDLVSHVKKLLKTCESIDSRDDIREILEVGMSLLRGSQREDAELLLHFISLAKAKLKSGADLEDVWKEGDSFIVKAGGPSRGEDGNLVLTGHKDPLNRKAISLPTYPSESNHLVISKLLQLEIDETLLALKQAQESEYKKAEAVFTAHKNIIVDLHRQIDQRRSEFSRNASLTDADAFHDYVRSEEDQIEKQMQEFDELKSMIKGSGTTS